MYVSTDHCPITGYPLRDKTGTKAKPVHSRADYMQEYYKKNKEQLLTNMKTKYHGKKTIQP